MTTPIERAALAITALRPHSGGGSEIVYEDAEDYARAALEAVLDRDELEAFLDSPTHAPRDTHSGADGSCLECPWPVHELPPADLADALRTWLLSESDEL